MAEKTLNVHKVTLGTGKVALLKEAQLKHQELAIRAVGNRAGDNQYLFGSLLQKELLKILLVQIDGKDLTPSELEKLDDLLTLPEYLQLVQVVSKLMGGAGGEELGEAKIEFVASGK